MSVAKKKAAKKKVRNTAKKSVKKKFAEGGKINDDQNENDMDENQQLQQDNATESVEGMPPHAPVQTQAPVVEPAPPPVVEEKKEEPIVQEIKEEVKPVEDKLKEVEDEIEKESDSNKHILSFFFGAVLGLCFGVRLNK